MFESLSRRPNLLAALCVVGLALYALNDLYNHAANERPFGARIKETDAGPQLEYLRDFPAHLRFARLAWSGYGDLLSLRGEVPPSIYSPFGHRMVMVRWLGREHTDRALPF